jgi:hypothetical protein
MHEGHLLPLDRIRRLADEGQFLAAVGDLYADLDAEIAGRGAVCVNRGACCTFGGFGHRLFVTPVELAYFCGRTEGPVRCPGDASHGDTCPYHRDGVCTARVGRPTGCRVFFCDPASQPWQGPLTERTLIALKELHGRFDLPYAYVDWMQALVVLAGV